MAIALNELLELKVSERIDLALKLWESIPNKAENIVISSNDEKELLSRYNDYLKNPKDGKSWIDIKSGIKK